MSEEKIKLKKKWYKKLPGVLFFLFLVCLIAFVIISTTRPQLGRIDIGSAYMGTSAEFENAVTDYQAKNNGSIPTLTGTYTTADCSDCHVVNISALLIVNGGLMKYAPTGLNLSANGNDNCGGNASLGCKKESSYIWLVNSNGDVYSYCAGTKCLTNNSGYQDVWP